MFANNISTTSELEIINFMASDNFLAVYEKKRGGGGWGVGNGCKPWPESSLVTS